MNRQLELYNSRDVDAFMSIVADDVLVMDGVTGAVLATGKEQLRCGAYTTYHRCNCQTIALQMHDAARLPCTGARADGGRAGDGHGAAQMGRAAERDGAMLLAKHCACDDGWQWTAAALGWRRTKSSAGGGGTACHHDTAYSIMLMWLGTPGNCFPVHWGPG